MSQVESQKQIHFFEKRYGVSFAQFEKDILPVLDTFQAHEDYNDWFFWQTVLIENAHLLSEKISGKLPGKWNYGNNS